MRVLDLGLAHFRSVGLNSVVRNRTKIVINVFRQDGEKLCASTTQSLPLPCVL